MGLDPPREQVESLGVEGVPELRCGCSTHTERAADEHSYGYWAWCLTDRDPTIVLHMRDPGSRGTAITALTSLMG